MSSPTISYLRFHILRVVRAQPIAVGVLAFCVVLAVGAAVALVAQSRRAGVAQALLADLRANATSAQATKVHPTNEPAAPDLPTFQSAPLVASLNDTAADSGLSLEEVTYSLDDNHNQPYLRYRITMTLNATYPLIRRLVEQLNTKVPHLTLDAINCSRKDVAVAELNCDVAMSGFFRKGTRG